MAAPPIVAAEIPVFAHGENDAIPRPVPSESRIKERAAVTNAPPNTAAQDTPDEWTSLAGTRATVGMDFGTTDENAEFSINDHTFPCRFKQLRITSSYKEV